MKRSADEYIRNLETACKFLKIERGRAREYVRHLVEFNRAETLTPEHLLAYYESCVIEELFDLLWKNYFEVFPGIEKKIRKACAKGPFLREDEMPKTSSNRPRNDAFCYLVAGKFLSAAISVVSVDGISSRHFTCETSADLTFLWENKHVSVECKRPQSQEAMRGLAKKALKQLSSTGGCGIIAIDCSVICRPNGTVFEASSQEEAEYELYEQLSHDILPELNSMSAELLLGFLLFSRIPAMTAIDLVDGGGKPIRRRECIISWLAVGSRVDQEYGILRKAADMLRAQTSDRR